MTENIKRRSFLKNLTASFGVLPFIPEFAQNLNNRLGKMSKDIESEKNPTLFWRRVREEFMLTPGLIHLNCGSIGATPRLVIDALTSYLHEVEANPVFKVFSWGGKEMEEVRKLAANFINADLDEVAITRNTTEGMNAIATGIDLKPGDQVLTTNHEHGGGMVCWQYLRKHHGIELIYLKMPKVVQSKQQIIDLVKKNITPRTKLCSFCHLDTITGMQWPLAEITAITRPKNILLVCDGAQAPGMLKVNVKELGVDAYASSSHKWMLAPKGSGLLYIRKDIQDRIHPTFLHSGYRSYTASGGTRNVAQILAHGVAIEFHNVIGRERIEERCRQLSAYLRSKLKEVPSLHPMTPNEHELSGGILTCTLEKGKNSDIVNRMSKEHQIILKGAQSTYAYCEDKGLPQENYNAIRFSTHIFNNEADIDRTVEILQKVLMKI